MSEHDQPIAANVLSLCAHVDRVVLMLDGDEAGQQGATTIADTLAARIAVTVIAIDDGCQPDQQSTASEYVIPPTAETGYGDLLAV